jgi:TonB family protein
MANLLSLLASHGGAIAFTAVWTAPMWTRAERVTRSLVTLASSESEMRNLLLSGALALSVLGGGAAHADNNVAPTSTSAARATVSAYIGEVSAELRSRLFYPRAARARGVVGVSFSIGPSGALTSLAITRSSGDPNLDAATRSLVEGARFPPPPGGSAHISTSFAYVPPR